MIGHPFGYGRRSEHAALGYSYFASQKREFFAEPLVSQLPDGFRLECEPNSTTLRVA